MKKYLVSLFVLFFALNVFSQEVEKDTTIAGEWKYAELGSENKKGLDDEMLVMMNQMFAGLSMILNADGTYSFNDGRMEEAGTYDYDTKKSVLNFVPSTKLKYSDNIKQPYDVKVVLFDGTRLEIQKGTLGLVLKK